MGFDAIVAAVKSERPVLRVGILQKDEGVLHPRSGKTLGEVAAANEFGDGVPTRSFIRAWVDERVAVFSEEFKKTYNIIIGAKFDPTVEHRELTALGKQYAKLIVDRIENFIPPPNAAFTVARKGFNHPLIETGLLVDSIDAEVTKK